MFAPNKGYGINRPNHNKYVWVGEVAILEELGGCLQRLTTS